MNAKLQPITAGELAGIIVCIVLLLLLLVVSIIIVIYLGR